MAEDTGQISDGYHTFDELYDHRCLLFMALMHAYPLRSWKSRLHADGTRYANWFVAGMTLPTGDITYHLRDWMWDLAPGEEKPMAPWDGHTSADVVNRLHMWLKQEVFD